MRALLFTCALALAVSACARRQLPSDPMDAGPAASGLFETLTPEQWRGRCVSDERGERCAALTQASAADDAELAALALNVERAAEFEHPFGDLHFSHGSRAAHSVSALLDLARSTETEPWVFAAVRDANRAFEGATDLRVLTTWTQTPLCGVSNAPAIEGPEGARCAALDGPCGRGRFQPQFGCCDLHPDLPGASCEQGVCDGAGACVPEGQIADEGRVHADDAFLEIWPEAQDAVLWHDGETDRVRDGAIDLMELPALQDDTRRARISIVHTGPDAALAAIAVSAPPGGALYSCALAASWPRRARCEETSTRLPPYAPIARRLAPSSLTAPVRRTACAASARRMGSSSVG